MRASHAHHIELSAGDRVPSRRDIGNASGMECGEVSRRPDFAGKVEMRSARHALDRYHVRQARIGVDMAPYDVQKIDHAAGLQPT